MTQPITLDQVSNTLSQVSFIINHEGSNIVSSDVYALCADVEDALAGLITLAKRIERSEQQRMIHQVDTFDRNQQALDFACDL
jgi:uncharacterized protein YfcZ (UPF0381/DUF406 family)